ncbi:MAG: ATP-binding cassette domain-containing protein [Actinobacteria bacterium]|nr:ATP-binding cassette domain-containing protein [Actinomycetota bacterium]
MAIIEFNNLSFTYRDSDKKAIDDISIQIDEGDYVVWMGHTGAGKSTLLYCLNSLIPKFVKGELEGSAFILGKDIRMTKVQNLSRDVGIVFQDFEAQLFSTNVELEIAFGAENLSVKREEIKKRINEILPLVRLDNLRDREPSTLSGGQKQRLAIASILAMRPKILALDEPTTDLDPIGKVEVLQLAKRLREIGTTMILVEHDTEEALNSDEMLLLNNGKMIRIGTPQRIVCDTKLLMEAGVAPIQVNEFYQKLLPHIRRNEIPLNLEEGISYFDKKFKIKENAIDLLRKKDRKYFEKIEDEIAVNVDNLSYTYPTGVKAVSDINLKIYKGEFVAIIGQNGSGKTTLVKHFNGLFYPTIGKVEIFGKDTKEMTRSNLGKIVGYVFQNPDHQIFAKTVWEEVSFGPRNYGLSEKEIEENVKQALSSVHLEGFEEMDPFTLTKGERQRVAVASVLAVKPQILILDEPTTGLDYIQQKSMMEMICNLNKKGHTVIIITHSMNTVAKYANRTIVVDDGRLLMDDLTRDIFSKEENLKKVYLQPPQITRFGNRLGITVLNVEEMIDSINFLKGD